MDWSLLFSTQKQLDTYIEKKHDLVNENLFEEKCLALLVELGELANETRCFKFWSTKPKSTEEVILEEYVDGLHFILSMGLEKGLFYQEVDYLQDNRTVTQQFNVVFEACIGFKNNPSQDNYNSLFNEFLHLGDLLGISNSRMEEAYFKKNEVNFERQNQGY